MSDVNGMVAKNLEDAAVRKNNLDVNDSVSNEIPKEYIEHYSGRLGEFDYDSREFKIIRGYLRYIGNETDGSKIKIPNGIKRCTLIFAKCTTLKTPPVIPNGVMSCESMFRGCTSLTTPPVIPDGVEICVDMFVDCTLLATPPVIPDSVENCRFMFLGCKSLSTPPVIPNSVKYCDYMFDVCKLLTKAPVIPNGVESFDAMFDDCSEEVQEAGKWNIEHRGQSYYDQN